MRQPKRRKVFISYHHHQDQKYRDKFVTMMGDAIVDKSVGDGDIDDSNIKTETVRQRIRDDFIAAATVTVVLIGVCTWRRKHVDWEIGASLMDTEKNPRCGLVGILLPTHPNFGKDHYDSHLIPPRLAANCEGDDPYACIYDWSGNIGEIREWIHQAFERRKGTPPNNSRKQFKNNRRSPCSKGWQN